MRQNEQKLLRRGEIRKKKTLREKDIEGVRNQERGTLRREDIEKGGQ